ncbi:MAG: tetratricopeptide repeat protein [Planctomycetota bacterium]
MKRQTTNCLLLLAVAAGGLSPSPALAQAAPAAISVTGSPLFAAEPSPELLARAQPYHDAYAAEPHDPDRLIWHARFLAYEGKYREAIDVLSAGIERFPKDARLRRHRGHRYITLRQFDKAIADFDVAIQLIQGMPNEIEPDGMPNAQNIPISTLHGNIYYHKGLAHYLRQEWEAALQAFEQCRSLKTNDDNLVSATHWIYMIHRRMGNEDAAQQALKPIHEDMQIIENFNYHTACLFYRGARSLEDVSGQSDETPATDAMRYAVANWHACNGDKEKALQVLQQIVEGEGWASFGHIAAEVDLVTAMKAQAD